MLHTDVWGRSYAESVEPESDIMEIWQCKWVHLSIKAHVVFPCCFANLPSTHQQLTILFYKSIIQKSHLVWQTALTRNNAAQWILLISHNWEHSRYLVVGTQTASEWGQILIPCCSHRGRICTLGEKHWRWLTRWKFGEKNRTPAIAYVSRSNCCTLMALFVCCTKML